MANYLSKKYTSGSIDNFCIFIPILDVIVNYRKSRGEIAWAIASHCWKFFFFPNSSLIEIIYLAGKCFKIQVEGNMCIFLSQTTEQDLQPVFSGKNVLTFCVSETDNPRLSTPSYYWLIKVKEKRLNESVASQAFLGSCFWYVCNLSFTCMKGWHLFYVA